MAKEELLKSLGARIVELRGKKDLSQQELASACNFEKSNMSRLESGNTNPTVYTLYKIAQALDVSLSKLMDFTYEE